MHGDELMPSDPLERLERLWRLGPRDYALVSDVLAAYVHAGRPRLAQSRLLQGVDEGVVTMDDASALAQRWSVDRWSGRRGGAPFHTSLAQGPGALNEAWRFVSPHPDDRFGLPPCVRPDRVIVVAQSVVVGMRFQRILGLDAHTGRVVWEHERRNVLRVAAPIWLGGRDRAECVGWPYVVETSTAADLCIEMFDPVTGDVLGTTRHTLDDAYVVSPDRELVAISEGAWAWHVTWNDESLRHDALILIDRETGEFQEDHLPGMPHESLVQDGDELFGIDDTGLVVWEGARVSSVHAFESTLPDDVIEGDALDPTGFRAGSTLSFYAPQYHEQGPSGRVVVRLNRPMRCDLTAPRRRAEALGEPRLRLRYLCASPWGHVVMARRRWGEGTSGDVVLLAPDGSWHSLVQRDDVSRVVAVWVGRIILLRDPAVLSSGDIRAGDTQRADLLTAVHAETGATRWTQPLGERWHQGPVPTASGLIGVHARGVSGWLVDA